MISILLCRIIFREDYHVYRKYIVTLDSVMYEEGKAWAVATHSGRAQETTRNGVVYSNKPREERQIRKHKWL